MALVILLKKQESAYIVRGSRRIGTMKNVSGSNSKIVFEDIEPGEVTIIRKKLWDKMEANRNGKKEE